MGYRVEGFAKLPSFVRQTLGPTTPAPHQDEGLGVRF